MTAGVTYYVIDSGVTTINVTGTTGTSNLITCDNAGLCILDMPSYFLEVRSVDSFRVIHIMLKQLIVALHLPFQKQ